MTMKELWCPVCDGRKYDGFMGGMPQRCTECGGVGKIFIDDDAKKTKMIKRKSKISNGVDRSGEPNE
jgi:hypothetical protein